MAANAKRVLSCKNVGGYVKRRGHQIEGLFIKQFGDKNDKITTKAEADCTIVSTNPITNILKEKLNITSYSVSVKTGKNLQFVLGRIPELTKNNDENLRILKDKCLWNKYLKKASSQNPANILAYYNNSTWTFFNMDDIIDFIVKKAKWRFLKTGRIKGDFTNGEKDMQYITYEHRKTHNSYFLGLNGNKGKPFIELLMRNIRYFTCQAEEI